MKVFIFDLLAYGENLDHIKQGTELGVKGTPTVFINGEIVPPDMRTVDGLPVVGHFKSLSRRYRSSSSARIAIDSVIRNL